MSELIFLDRFFDKIGNINLFSKRRKLGWICAILLCVVPIFILNILTPLSADDFGYLFIHGEGATRVTGLSDIIESQYQHYMKWGGRSVVHFIAQALLLLPPLVIDALNTLMYVLYVSLIYLIVRGKGSNSISLFVLINSVIWIIQPAFGDTVLWITGSANYLWGTSLILLFILPYRFYDGQSKGSKLKAIVLAIGFGVYGFIAGWTNENTAGAMILLTVMFLCYYRYKKWSIPAWAIVGLITALIGYLVMISAPGNMVRAGEAGEIKIFLVCYRIFMHSMVLFVDYGGYILAFFILLIVVLRQNNNRDVILFALMFFIASISGIYVMVFSPSFPPRAWFGVLSFLLIGIGLLYYNLDFNSTAVRCVRNVTLVLCSVMYGYLFYAGFADARQFHIISNERANQVEMAKAKGESSCEFVRYISSSKFVHTEEPESNHMMSWYYGLEIKFEEGLSK